MAGMAIRFARGRGTARNTRRRVRARGRRTASRVGRRRHTSCRRRPCRVRLGQSVAELPLEILMRGDGPPARIRAAYSLELNQYRWEPTPVTGRLRLMSLTMSVGRPDVMATAGGEPVLTHEHHASSGRWTANAATAALDWSGVG